MIAAVKQDASLTRRQAETLEFIRGVVTQRGYAPTLREITSHFGYRSVNSAASLIKALEKKGRVTRGSRVALGKSVIPDRFRADAIALRQRLQSEGDTLTSETLAQVNQFVALCAGEIA